jgi:ABC-type polysaccharide/polyol phosphate export permease
MGLILDFMALINPIFQLIIYYFVFSVFFKTMFLILASNSFSGLILWMFISKVIKKGMFTISSNRHLIEMIRLTNMTLLLLITQQHIRAHL